MKVKVEVTQSCPTLCNPMDYTVHGTLQARVLEWVVAIPLLQGIFPTQGWNQGFPYCSQILYISMCVCIYIDIHTMLIHYILLAMLSIILIYLFPNITKQLI